MSKLRVGICRRHAIRCRKKKEKLSFFSSRHRPIRATCNVYAAYEHFRCVFFFFLILVGDHKNKIGSYINHTFVYRQ